MFGTIFKILYYLFPFIKEVFIQSNENVRVWFGRIVVIVAIAICLSWLYTDHMNDKIDVLERENSHLRKTNQTLQLDIAKNNTQLEVFDRTLREKQYAIDSVNQSYRKAERRVEKLNKQMTDLQKELSGLKHSLSQSECKDLLMSAPAPSEENSDRVDRLRELK